MLFATAGQAALMLWMAGAGAVIVVWYALMSLLRRFVQAGFILNLLIDLLFGAGAAGIYLYFLISGNHGAFRPFTLVGTALGATVFAVGLRRPVTSIYSFLNNNFVKIVTAIRKNRRINIIFK